MLKACCDVHMHASTQPEDLCIVFFVIYNVVLFSNMLRQHCARLSTLPDCTSDTAHAWGAHWHSSLALHCFVHGQCSWWLWYRVRFMLKEARQGSAAANRAAAQAAEQEAAHRRQEAQRRLQPRTSADFALLYSELEAWRLAETARIKAAGLSAEECHQALAHLLHQVGPWLATQLAFTWRMIIALCWKQKLGHAPGSGNFAFMMQNAW
jgi:hypothetical protein